MSIDSCKDCSRSVDTDVDDKAYIIVLPNGLDVDTGVCRCDDCRHVDALSREDRHRLIDEYWKDGTSKERADQIDALLYSKGLPIGWHSLINEAAPDRRTAIDP